MMNRKRNKCVLALPLLLAGSLYVGGVAQAKTDATETFLREDLIASSGASIDENAPGQSHRPVILDVLDLKNMDVLDVLKLISQKSGINIMAGHDVKGKVTVFLKNVEAGEALRMIVESYGWAHVRDGDIIRIMTDKEYETRYGHRFGHETETRVKRLSFAKATDVVALLNQVKGPSGKVAVDQRSGMLVLTDEPEKLEAMDGIIRQADIPVETEVFVLNYAKAQEVSTKIDKLMTPSMGTMTFDDRSNRIVVSDSASQIEEIRKVIKALDQKDREVLIEAKIVQIVLSDEYKLGVDWEAIVSDFHSLKLTGNFDVLGDTEKRGKLSIGTVKADGYTALVEALETVGHTDILSSPRIAAVNNKEAKILVGSTEPYVTTTTTTPSSGPTTTAESVNFIDVGVKLFVTPTIHEDDFITMNIKPEVSSVVNNVTTGNNNTIPVVETSEAATTVIVKDDVTIVIGGLIKEEKIKTTKKVPVLGSIPLLGFAFRNRSDLVRKTEIVIFLTARIISGDAGGEGPPAVF